MKQANLETSCHAPAWRPAIEQALKSAKNVHTSTYVQLATVDSQGAAQVRTMVWRGFTELNDGFLMATDVRSEKVSNVSVESRGQIVWYFADAREQFRFSGDLVCLSALSADQSLRKAVWTTMSKRARRSFFSNTLGELDNNAVQAADSDEPSCNFAVLKLAVVEVDHLRLNQDPHRRSRYTLKDRIWTENPIEL